MKNELFQIAMDNVRELTIRINSDKTKYTKPNSLWCKIIPDSTNSPLVKSISEYKHLIYFPENSEPYNHIAENFAKEAIIKSGTILEKHSGRIYNEGDKFVIPANTEVCPVSVGGEAFAMVKLVEG